MGAKRILGSGFLCCACVWDSASVELKLWGLMGAIVSFYFGARHQVKSQEFQRSLATTLARTQDVVRNIEALEALNDGNAALDDWRRSRVG